MKYQRIYLASHVLYGSSRLGTKDYLPGQYYVLRDYRGPSPIIDSITLTHRRPWYSMKYNDNIHYFATEPWHSTYHQAYVMSERSGEKQYELTNHLGNVQATVSDNKVVRSDGSGQVTGWHPALRSAYDYYPFGMLMPGRYISDTSSHCITISQPKWEWKWVTISCWDVYDWVWPSYQVEGNGMAYVSDEVVVIDAEESGDGVSFGSDVLAGQEHLLQLSVQRVGYAGAHAMVQVMEQVNGRWERLAAQPIKAGMRTIELSFTPTTNHIRIEWWGPVLVYLYTECIAGMDWVQEEALVTICDGDKDKYRFGYYGGEKINEWAGWKFR